MSALFDDLPDASPEQVQLALGKDAARRRAGLVRLLEPRRLQIALRSSHQDSLLPADHRARRVWGYFVRQALSQPVARAMAQFDGCKSALERSAAA